MACEVQINSVNYLQKQGAIDEVNKVVDEKLFDDLNDKMTSLAEIKYGLRPLGEKLFNLRLSEAVPNEALFEIFQDNFNSVQFNSINVSQKIAPGIKFMSEEDVRSIMSFDEVEDVSNMIMNKLSLKERPYYMRNRKGIKRDIWYNDDAYVMSTIVENLLENIFGQEVLRQTKLQQLDRKSSLTERLEAFNKSTEIPNAIKEALKDIKSNDYYLKEAIDNTKKAVEELELELNVINGFIKYKDKSKISSYSKKNQATIKKYFKSLYEENKFKSDAQAIAFLGRNAVKKIKSNIKFTKNKVFTYSNAIKSKTKKLETLSNFIKIIPNWKQLVNDRIDNQVTRILEFKNRELQQNPNIEKAILMRKLFQASTWMNQEIEFSKKDVLPIEAKKKIKKIFPDYDSSLHIPATSDTVTVLQSIANNPDSEYKDLAKKLIPFAEKNNIPINVLHLFSEEKKGAAAYYNAKVKRLNDKYTFIADVEASYITEQYINLHHNSERFRVDPERLVMHEIVHSLSTIAIAAESYRVDTLKKKEFDALPNKTRREKLQGADRNPYDKFLKYLKDQVIILQDKSLMGAYQFSMPYGFTNTDELFAEALTNPEFQELLRQVPPMNKKEFSNLFEELLDFIRRLFNINNYSNALEQLEDVIQATMDFQNDLGLSKEEALKEANETLAKIKKGDISANQKVKSKEPTFYYRDSIYQDKNSYYRGQYDAPKIDSEGNLILFGVKDELYERAGLKSIGVSMTDNLESAISYGQGQLEVRKNLAMDSYDVEEELEELDENGWYLIQIPKNISNEIIKEEGEVKIVGNKVVIPKGQYKIENITEYGTTITPSLPIINFNYNAIETLNNQRSKQLAEVLSQRLALGLDVNYQNVSKEEAADILKNRAVKYNGEPGFYYAGTVYLVGENITPRTVIHEFGHPLLQGLRMKNNILFQKLYKQAIGTEEGQGIKFYVESQYPELDQNTDFFKEEVINYALQLSAINKMNDQINTEGFEKFIQNVMAAIKKMLRGIFGSKVKVSKISVDTSIEELADLLLEGQVEIDIPSNLKEEDIVMFGRDVLARAKELDKFSDKESMQKMIDQIYETTKRVLTEAENFKGDKVSRTMLKETLFQKGTTRYLREVTSTLKDYLNTDVEEFDENEKIQNALDAVKESLDADLQRATALVNTLDTTNSMLKNMLSNINKINKSNINNRSTIALLMLYKQNSKAWLKMVEEINEALSIDGKMIDSSNPFYNNLNEIVQNITRVNTNIANLLKTNNVQFYVEITGYMSEYVEKRLRENLGTALKRALNPVELENAVNDLYYKVTTNTIEDSDIDALIEKGVPKDILKGFLQEYKDIVIDKDKITEALTGGAHDITWFNRWLESYSSSNDVVVGPLSMFIENEKSQVENIVWEKSLKFRKKLEKLLPAVGFSKLNSPAMREKLGFLDTVFWVDEEGKPIEKKIWSYHGAFKDYRYYYDLLEYNLEEAKKSEDVNKIADAQFEFDTFKKDYMWQDFVPEFYEKDDIFKQSKAGKLAYYVRKQKLAAYNNLVNSMENELERFQEYSTIKAAFREYQQLFALTYEDGTPKVDDEAKGIYDLSIANVLQEHREATKEFYERRPMEGMLQSAYNEFVDLLATKDILPGDKEYKREMKMWERQNLRMDIDPEYWEMKNDLLTELREIQERIQETGRNQFDVAGAYKIIGDLVFTYKDQAGEPNSSDMGNDRLERVRDLEQEISDYRANIDSRTGLTRDDADEFNRLSQKATDGALESGSPEAERYFYLLDKVEETGISGQDVTRMNQIIAELGSMTEKLPTIYYMEALNYNLSRLDIEEVSEDEVEDVVNGDEFQELLEEDQKLREWFEINHYTIQKYNRETKAYESYFKRTSANNVSSPTDEKYIKFTEIIDKNTGEPILLKGAPGIRHSRNEVKDEYRTIPFGAKKADYVGKYIDNKNQWLPRLYQPGQKYSAKDGRFINEKYFQMKSANNAEYKLIEAITEYHLANQEGVSNYSKLYLDMPRYALKRGDIWQAMQKGTYGKRFGELGRNVKEWVRQSFVKTKVDAELDFNYDAKNNLVNTNLDGNQITYVPVSGIYNIDQEITDADTFSGLFRYALSVQTQSKLLESLPLVNSILDTLEDPANAPKELEKFDKGIFNLKGQLQKAKKKFSTNNRLGQVKSLIEREYFGRLVEGIEETHPVFGKMMGTLQGLSAMGSLAVNIPSDLKNKYGAYVQVLIEGLGAEFITLKDFALARPWAEKSMLEWTTKGIYQTGPGAISTQLIQFFDPVFKSKDQFGKEIERSLIKDLANGEWMYMHRKFGEMQVSVSLFGAFMFGQKIDQLLTDGTKKTMRYIDAWEKDAEGIIRLKSGIHPGWSNLPVFHEYQRGETLEEIAKKYYIPVEELKAKNRIKTAVQLEDGQEIIIAKSEKFLGLKNRIQGTSRKLFGTYDAIGQAEGNKLLLYKMFFFMRKWFTPMFMNRFGFDSKTATWTRGGERYDWATTSYGKGFYVTAFQALVKTIKSGGRNAAYLSTEEKVSLRKMAGEGIAVIGLSLLALMLFGFDPEDDDKWDKIKKRSGAYGQDTFNTYGFLSNHMLLLILGAQAESSAFVPLPSIKGLNLGMDDYTKMITQTTSAWYNTIVLYADIMGDVLDFVTFSEMDRYKRDVGTMSWKEKGDLKIWAKFRKVFGRTGSSEDPEYTIKNMIKSQTRLGQ